MSFLKAASAPAQSEVEFLEELITRLERECPRRESASADEHRAQEILGDELAARGLEVEEFSFRYSPSLYAVIGLHCAIATFASTLYLWRPLVGAALHAFVAIAYAVDAHYRGFWLRRCLPWRKSHNIVARLPVEGTPRRRIVMIGHADAAPTGWMFSRSFLKIAHKPWPSRLLLLRKQMLGFTFAMLLLATLDVVIATTGQWFPFAYYGFTLAAAIPLILMLQIVITNRTVPGANDNLTGCAAVVLLAERFAAKPLRDTELVFVISGCEEAGRGGAWALEQQMRGVWDPKTTTILGLDTLSSGQIRYHVEGELLPIWPTRQLLQLVDTVAASDERFAGMSPYHAPAGATDVAPFIWKSYDGLCVTRIDPTTDIPPNYHVLADCAANVSGEDVRDAVDFTEQLARAIAGQASFSGLEGNERVEASRAEALEVDRNEAKA